MVRYGVFDTKDNLWLGDGKGPRTWGAGDPLPSKTHPWIETNEEAFTFARIAAELAVIQLHWDMNRAKAMEVPEDQWHIVDEIEPKMTTLQALRRKERGTLP